MLISPEEFERSWGSDKLVRLSAQFVAALVSERDREFLKRAGLPAMIRYFAGATDGLITFCRLASGLKPLLSQETVGPALPLEWSIYSIMGDEFFCNGTAWWCIHGALGHVERIDIEIEQPIEFVNSSVGHFASALLAASMWSGSGSPKKQDWPCDVDRLMAELAEIDPPSMQSRRNFWPMWLNFIRDEGPHLRVFERGSRDEGERALEVGPW